MKLKKFYIFVIVFITQLSIGQEGLPVYSDYLSDNIF